MGKVRTDDEQRTEPRSGDRDSAAFATDDEFNIAFAIESTRWASLAERLK
ncbi:hypothetical protein [Rhodococcus sp. IEGM 1330]|nr:hypothetical protein [Rhodococcus sp. IEGM 1330]MDV8022265.1 hypothetical protein [Rhodococcus sp. IEGM 1330]